ncbi:MAG: hypothetical protein IPG85_03430 [Bacteroidetes bacterium]|nr:hypothetical protein [Bacteroidota bacterium]
MFIFVALKKIIPILLLAIYVFGATSFSQLLRIHHFVIHYQEHKQHNQQISFADFFIIHYVNEPIKDADYDKDMKLPFKSDIPSFYNIAICQNEASKNFDTPTPYFIDKQDFNLYDSSFLSALYLASIWQPPRSIA